MFIRRLFSPRLFSHSYDPVEVACVREKSEFDIVPFGHRCTSAIVCTYADLRKFSLPFDWVIPLRPRRIMAVLDNDFDGFIPADIQDRNFRNRYGLTLAHFNSDIEAGVATYQRRISRFLTLMANNKRKYFIYVNEDYLYSAQHRVPDFGNRFFEDMLALEVWLKNKYPGIEYRILYFDFVARQIPANSNIISITLSSRQYWNDAARAPYEKLRKYVGQVLADIFGTRYTGKAVFSEFNE